MKLIGCTDSELSKGGVLDPVDPSPFRGGGEHLLLGLLQLRHSRRRICDLVDADRGPLRTQDDRLSRILDDEVPRDSLLGDELECAVLEVLVGDVAVVQERDVRVGGPDLPSSARRSVP